MHPDRLLPPRTVHPPAPAGALLGWFLLFLAWTFLALGAADWWGVMSLSPATWYLARSSGLVLFGLSWVMMISGLSTTTKLLDSAWARHIQHSVHTYAFDLWCGFLLLHLASLLIDPTVKFGVADLVVPWVSGFREPWTGLGVLAAEITILIGGSAGLRRWLGFRVWRSLHWLAFPVFVLGLAHGLGSGTDATRAPVGLMYLVAAATVCFMACYRVVRGRARQHDRYLRQTPIAGRPATVESSSPAFDRFATAERTRGDAAPHRRR